VSNILFNDKDGAVIQAAVQFLETDLQKHGTTINNSNALIYVRKISDYAVFLPAEKDVVVIGLAQHLRNKGFDLVPLKADVKLAIQRHKCRLRKGYGLMAQAASHSLYAFASKIGV
jgi:hypothetical protein